MGKWDAIIVIPSRDVTIMGIGIYEAEPSIDFEIGWKYVIEDSAGSEIFKSEIYEESVSKEGADDCIIKHQFQNVKGIEVKNDQRIHICMWMRVSNCRYSEAGSNYDDIENEHMGLFQFKNSALSSNSTEVNRGIIPAILYRQ